MDDHLFPLWVLLSSEKMLARMASSSPTFLEGVMSTSLHRMDGGQLRPGDEGMATSLHTGDMTSALFG